MRRQSSTATPTCTSPWTRQSQRPEPIAAPTDETTPRLNKLAEDAEERLEKATGELEAGTEELEKIETLEEVLGGVAADIAPSDRR